MPRFSPFSTHLSTFFVCIHFFINKPWSVTVIIKSLFMPDYDFIVVHHPSFFGNWEKMAQQSSFVHRKIGFSTRE